MFPSPDARSERFTLHAVPWSTVLAIDELVDGRDGLRFAFHGGTLELARYPLIHHATAKILTRLIEAYATERGIDLRGYGHITVKNEDALAAIQADQWYHLGQLSEGETPNIALHVFPPYGEGPPAMPDLHDQLGKREIYASLGVQELWIAYRRQLYMYTLSNGDGAYGRITSSLLVGLDPGQLARFGDPLEAEQTGLVNGYVAELRKLTP